jgi:hypothetical protein
MTWRTLLISFAFGVAIDVALVWLYYWWNAEPFKWTGFLVWQAVLIAAGVLLWLRRVLGFVIWYLFFGREAIASEAFQKYLEFEFKDFDKEWDDMEGWLTDHTQQGQSSAATELLGGLAITRQAGVLQYFMLNSAYRKAAVKYSGYLKRKGLL